MLVFVLIHFCRSVKTSYLRFLAGRVNTYLWYLYDNIIITIICLCSTLVAVQTTAKIAGRLLLRCIIRIVTRSRVECWTYNYISVHTRAHLRPFIYIYIIAAIDRDGYYISSGFEFLFFVKRARSHLQQDMRNDPVVYRV